jgi:hypothetical protein
MLNQLQFAQLMLHLLSHSQHKADPFRSYKGEPHNLAFMLSFYQVVVLQFSKMDRNIYIVL